MKKQTIILVSAILALALLGGCGDQSEEANEMVREANSAIAEVQPRLERVESLLFEVGKLTAPADQAVASLTEAQTLIDEIEAGIGDALDTIEEAAELNVSDSTRRYLDAKAAALNAMLELTGTMRQLTEVLLADPEAANPETLQQWAELGQVMSDQGARLQEAEAQAGKILEEDGE